MWYNYGAATAGTIVNAGNISDTTTATQSICPKGWSLPAKTQIDSLSGGSSSTAYVGSFSPVLGGYYDYGTLHDESTYGYWWNSTAHNGAVRRALYYKGSSLYTGSGGRSSGLYVRCVSEEKDVSDLTYMQDMTPSVAANTAEGALAVILKNHKIWYNSIKDRIQLVIFI